RLTQVKAGNDLGLAIFWKRATGSNALTVNHSDGEKSAWVSLRITGAENPSVTGAGATGDSNNPDPPNYNAGSSKDWLWFAAAAINDDVTFSGFPSGYTGNLQVKSSGAGSGAIAVAWKAT